MFNLAIITLPELVPILSIFVGMLVAFYAFAKFILGQAEKASTADREERQLDRLERQEMTKAFNRVADATEIGAREAKERNGHLADISNQNRDTILTAVSNISEQRVEHQTVEKQEIKE